MLKTLLIPFSWNDVQLYQLSGKSHVWYPCRPTGMAKITKTPTIKCWWGCVGTGTLTSDGCLNWYSY